MFLWDTYSTAFLWPNFFPSPIYLLVFLLQGPRYQIYFSHKFSILFDRFIQLNTKLLLSTCNVQFFNAQSSFLTQLMPIKHESQSKRVIVSIETLSPSYSPFPNGKSAIKTASIIAPGTPVRLQFHNNPSQGLWYLDISSRWDKIEKGYQ